MIDRPGVQAEPPDGYVMIPADQFRELCGEWITDGFYHQVHQLIQVTIGDWRPPERRET